MTVNIHDVMPKSVTKKNQEDLKQKAEACLAKKADIPMAPLWHMGKAAKFNSDGCIPVF